MSKELIKEVRVKITRCGQNHDLPLPAYFSEEAAGLDVPAAVASAVVVRPGEIAMIPTGLAVAIPPGYEGQVRPRSGLASRLGLTLVNSPGTIDSDYRGEIQISVINHGSEPVEISRGMRIAQLLVLPVPRVIWDECEILPESDRSDGGFGHTG